MLKNRITLFTLVSIFSATFSHVGYADRAAQSTATWYTTAVKDTKSALIVTPLKSLTFNYAIGQKSFNQQSGAFDISIQGQEGATDFKLTSRLVDGTLTSVTDSSKLFVVAKWINEELSTSKDVVLIDTMRGINAGLENLAINGNYNSSSRQADRSDFTFVIKSAQSSGGEATTFDSLPDGVWDGDVKIQFTATWTGDFK